MSGPWSGTRVVDLGGLTTAYGTRLLAALGAEVIVVEPPGGSPLRTMDPHLPDVAAPESSAWWAYLAAGKRSVVVDLSDDAASDSLGALLASADVVIDDAQPRDQDRPGWGMSAIRDRSPATTWIAVTPFGLTGPRRDWFTSDLVAWASCGLASTVGFPDRAPLAPAAPLQVAMHYVSINATIAALLALRGRRKTGRGQLVDLSIQEVMLSMAPETGVPLFLDDQVARPRAGNRRPVTSPFGLYACADGYVAMLVIQPNHWRAMAQWIFDETGNEGVQDEVFDDMTVRNEASDAIDAWTEEVTMASTKLELFVEGQRRGIPITPVNTVADLRSDPHLRKADWWTEHDHPALGQFEVPGAPFGVSHEWWAFAHAPLLGADTVEVLGSGEG